MSSRGAESEPNVLWIMTDEHVFDALGCAGHPVVETPNLDEFAASSLFFENAYSPSPVCGPARASLFTGLYPPAHGVTGNWTTFNEGVALLPELLQEGGYHTGMAGKLHFTPAAAPHGFDDKRLHDAMYDVYNPEEPWNSDYVAWLAEERFDGDREAVIDRANADELSRQSVSDHPTDPKRFFLGSNWRDEGEHSNDWVARETVDFLGAEPAEPFFFYASFFAPHHQWLSGPPWDGMYDPDDVLLPEDFYVDTEDRPIAGGGRFDAAGWDEDDYRELLAGYYGVISHVDDAVGRILDALDEQGLREETVVIFTADHGDYAGQFGWFTKGGMYARSVRIPLIVRDPAFPGSHGERSDRIVNNLGLFSTVLERAGVDTPDTSSRSLTPLLERPDAPEWDNWTYSDNGTTVIVRDDLKLIRDRTENGRMVHELYDVTDRPLDGENLWDDPAYDEERRELLAMLDLEEERAESYRPDG
jgi:arylsulfatase A-like enzyme